MESLEELLSLLEECAGEDGEKEDTTTKVSNFGKEIVCPEDEEITDDDEVKPPPKLKGKMKAKLNAEKKMDMKNKLKSAALDWTNNKFQSVR